MSRFKFSKRSLDHIDDIDENLAAVCHTAIDLTKIDFGIIDGVRTLEEQQALVDAGASQTLNSKHLNGEAVDVMAYVGARGSWELPLYAKIADAFKASAIQHGVIIRWGGAWHIPDIREWQGDMQSAMDDYVRTRRKQGRRPFVDAGHFELN